MSNHSSPFLQHSDSKLTRVLQDSLGGRSKTVIIATVSPSDLAIAESISTLNYAQAANGIINKPISSSHHVSQHRAQPGVESSGASVEQWYELECKLKYMEAQVEEAQTALARKNQQQQVMLNKVTEFEKEVALKEKIIRQAVERIDSLENALGKERKKTESLTHELKLAEASLIRTNAVLEATQHTEEKLTSEARQLITAVKTSIQDGDEMYKILLDEREDDVERKAETKTFHNVTLTILKDLDTRMQDVLTTEEDFCRNVVTTTEEESKSGKRALVDTVDALKDINTTVKTLITAMANMCTEVNGIIPVLDSSTSNIQSELSDGLQILEKGKLGVLSTTESARENLNLHSDTVQKTSTKARKNTGEILESLMMKLHTTRAELIQATESLMKSSSEIASESSRTRQELGKAILNIKKMSIIAMKNVGSCALKQYKQMNQSITTFTEGMEHIAEANDELDNQKKSVCAKSKSQLGSISSQLSMLSIQKEAFSEAHALQRQCHSTAMKTIMSGLQQLLQNEFSKLDTNADTNFDSLQIDNSEITELNNSINHSAREIVNEVEVSNKNLVEQVNAIAKNDNGLLDESMKTSAALAEIKETARNHYRFVDESGKVTNQKMEELSSYDKPLQNVMDQFQIDNNAAADSITNDVGTFATEGIEKIDTNITSMSTFVSEMVIPDALEAIGKTAEDCDGVFSDISNNFAVIQETSSQGQAAITNQVQKQRQTGDQLQRSVTTKCSEFRKKIVLVRREEIESYCVLATKNAANHVNSTKSTISSMQNLSTGVGDHVSTYSKDVIHIHDPTPSVNPRNEVSFSKKLSSTPSENRIMALLSQKNLEISRSQDENQQVISPVMKLEARDDAPFNAQFDEPSTSRTPISPLSSRHNSPTRTSPRNFRY